MLIGLGGVFLDVMCCVAGKGKGIVRIVRKLSHPGYLTGLKEYLSKPNYFKIAKGTDIFLENWCNRVIIAPHFVKNSDMFISFGVFFSVLDSNWLIQVFFKCLCFGIYYVFGHVANMHWFGFVKGNVAYCVHVCPHCFIAFAERQAANLFVPQG